MKNLLNSRKALLIAAMVITVAAFVVPVCQMVGCQMGYMGFMHGAEFGVSGNCGGEWAVNQAPTGVVPTSMDALLLALLASVAAATMLLRPHLAVRTVRFIDESPPEPPFDPRGARFRV